MEVDAVNDLWEFRGESDVVLLLQFSVSESFKEIIRCKFSLKLVQRKGRAGSRSTFAMHGILKGQSS